MTNLQLKAATCERDLVESELQSLKLKHSRLTSNYLQEVQQLRQLAFQLLKQAKESSLPLPSSDVLRVLFDKDQFIDAQETCPQLLEDNETIVNLQNIISDYSVDFANEIASIHDSISEVLAENSSHKDAITSLKQDLLNLNESKTKLENDLTSRCNTLEMSLTIAEENLRLVRRERDLANTRVEQLEEELCRVSTNPGSNQHEFGEDLVLEISSIANLLSFNDDVSDDVTSDES
ncbi:hypothetical protein GEMRC1_000693 [Eukaryota sp. GEM-RC1]